MALGENLTGEDNTAIGANALLHATGSENAALGNLAGYDVTTGSNNIDISNRGEAADADTTRIGTEGTQKKAFMAGIYKVTLPLPYKTCVVKVNEKGQLGCIVEKVKKAAGVNDEELSALLAQVSHQQQEISRLASEVKALRK